MIPEDSPKSEMVSKLKLFGNLELQTFSTRFGTLRLVGIENSIAAYEFEYVHRMEINPKSNSQLVMGDEDRVVDQLCALLSVVLRGYFSTSIELIQRTCSLVKGQRFVNDYLDLGRKVEPDARTVEYFEHIVLMERSNFLAYAGCAQAIVSALEYLHSDYDTAYAMLIFAAESLPQKLDGYFPEWAHHPKRDQIDKIIQNIDPETATKIRNALTNDAILKCQYRYVAFLEDHLTSSFFTEEAKYIRSPLRKSELKGVLAEGYVLRSKYAHELAGIQEEIKIPQIALDDVFRSENKRYLTFCGMLRLLSHVVNQFVLRSPQVENEGFRLRDLPGVVRFPVSHMHWDYSDTRMTLDNISTIVQEFFELLATFFNTGDESVVRYYSIVKKATTLFDSASEKQRRMLFTMIVLWTTVCRRYVKDDDPMNSVIDGNKALANACTMETMIWAILLGEDLWTGTEMAAIYSKYVKDRLKADRQQYPFPLEILVMISIAFRFGREGNVEARNNWLYDAILDVPGDSVLQAKFHEAIDTGRDFAPYDVIFGPPSNDIGSEEVQSPKIS